MLSTTVINISDHDQTDQNPAYIYMGRPSKWGNPFKIDEHGTRWEVIKKHAEWLAEQPELIAEIPELQGKTRQMHQDAAGQSNVATGPQQNE